MHIPGLSVRRSCPWDAGSSRTAVRQRVESQRVEEDNEFNAANPQLIVGRLPHWFLVGTDGNRPEGRPCVALIQVSRCCAASAGGDCKDLVPEHAAQFALLREASSRSEGVKMPLVGHALVACDLQSLFSLAEGSAIVESFRNWRHAWHMAVGRQRQAGRLVSLDEHGASMLVSQRIPAGTQLGLMVLPEPLARRLQMQKPRVVCLSSRVTCSLRIPLLPHPGEGDVVADADADDAVADACGLPCT